MLVKEGKTIIAREQQVRKAVRKILLEQDTPATQPAGDQDQIAAERQAAAEAEIDRVIAESLTSLFTNFLFGKSRTEQEKIIIELLGGSDPNKSMLGPFPTTATDPTNNQKRTVDNPISWIRLKTSKVPVGDDVAIIKFVTNYYSLKLKKIFPNGFEIPKSDATGKAAPDLGVMKVKPEQIVLALCLSLHPEDDLSTSLTKLTLDEFRQITNTITLGASMPEGERNVVATAWQKLAATVASRYKGLGADVIFTPEDLVRAAELTPPGAPEFVPPVPEKLPAEIDLTSLAEEFRKIVNDVDKVRLKFAKSNGKIADAAVKIQEALTGSPLGVPETRWTPELGFKMPGDIFQTRSDLLSLCNALLSSWDEGLLVMGSFGEGDWSNRFSKSNIGGLTVAVYAAARINKRNLKAQENLLAWGIAPAAVLSVAGVGAAAVSAAGLSSKGFPSFASWAASRLQSVLTYFRGTREERIIKNAAKIRLKNQQIKAAEAEKLAKIQVGEEVSRKTWGEIYDEIAGRAVLARREAQAAAAPVRIARAEAKQVIKSLKDQIKRFKPKGAVSNEINSLADEISRTLEGGRSLSAKEISELRNNIRKIREIIRRESLELDNASLDVLEDIADDAAMYIEAGSESAYFASVDTYDHYEILGDHSKNLADFLRNLEQAKTKKITTIEGQIAEVNVPAVKTGLTGNPEFMAFAKEITWPTIASLAVADTFLMIGAYLVARYMAIDAGASSSGAAMNDIVLQLNGEVDGQPVTENPAAALACLESDPDLTASVDELVKSVSFWTAGATATGTDDDNVNAAIAACKKVMQGAADYDPAVANEIDALRAAYNKIK